MSKKEDILDVLQSSGKNTKYGNKLNLKNIII